MRNDYVWQKVHEAIDALLWTEDPNRVQHAFIALGNLQPAHLAQLNAEERPLWAKVESYLERDGSGLEKAQRMTKSEKREFCEALWSLYGHLERDVWGSGG